MLPEFCKPYLFCEERCGGLTWLVRSSPGLAVSVGTLAGDIMLCSWARHLTLTVPLSTQEYKWVVANCWGNLTNCKE